ncbi:MAG: EamA family transporter, partial [Chitinophagales bacterium]
YVNPVVAVLLGFLLLHEKFGILTLLAMVITIAGVYLVNAGFKQKKDQPSFLRKLSMVPALLKLW